jgi:hypothetical protein
MAMATSAPSQLNSSTTDKAKNHGRRFRGGAKGAGGAGSAGSAGPLAVGGGARLLVFLPMDFNRGTDLRRD